MFSSFAFVDYSSPPILQFTFVSVRYQSEKKKKQKVLFCRSSDYVQILQEQGGEMTLMSGILMSMRGQHGFLLSFIECDIHLILLFIGLWAPQ